MANYAFTKPNATDPRNNPSHSALHGQEVDCITDLNNRVTTLEGSSSTPLTSTGSPEGVKTASVGQICWDTTNLTLYVKNTGSGNIGWVALLSMT